MHSSATIVRPGAATPVLLAPYAARLADLADEHRLRALRPREGHDFASNDYLGLAADPALAAAVADALARGVPVGSGGSRLLRGNHPEHEALEDAAARWIGCESTLFLASGYAANAALLATLPQAGDVIVHDALIHASAREGMRLSRARHVAAGHNDAQAVEEAIRAWRARGGGGRPWIVAEALYSMDGDTAPLAELAEIARRHEGWLVVDEAHSGGVFGPQGRGLAAAAGLAGAENLVTLHTCGKALGVEGALLGLPAVLRAYMINQARGFVFTTAPSPLMAAAVRAAIALVAAADDRRAALRALVARAGARLARHGATVTGTQILPLVLGADEAAMRAAGRLQVAGFDVRGIRPPTVPAGTARLRLSITRNVDAATIDALDVALEEALA